jgi:hypothetical protein
MAGIDEFTKLMLHMNGDDESTDFPDDSDSEHVATPSGNAQISTDQSKFGGSSLYCDGSASFLTVPDHDDFEFGLGDFTIDFWYRPAGTASLRILVAKYAQSAYGSFVPFQNGNTITLYASSNNSSWDVASNRPIVAGLLSNVWMHFAYVREGGTTYTSYLDGNQVDTFENSSELQDGTQNIQIGGVPSSFYYTGYIDEVRISKGIARWTENFTPPTEAYFAGEPPPPVIEKVTLDKYFVLPQIPKVKKPKTNPGFSITPAMHVPVPIKLDKWEHIKNTPARVRKRNRANVTQNVLVQFNTPAAEIITIDKWIQQYPIPTKRFEKRIPYKAEFTISFVEAWQEKDGNYQDTGVYGFQITDVSIDAATFKDVDPFSGTITAVHVEDFQLEDEEAFDFKIHYPETGSEVFNSGVPGFVSASVTINGVNESSMMEGTITVTREDNTAARFKCTLELDQTLSPPRKPAELINKVVAINFASADMDGVVADYIPIFLGLCKHVTFNDDQQSMVLTGYDYGGVHQTKGELVSDNVTTVLTGSLHVSSAATHSLGHSPVWGVVWSGNNTVTDGEDYFVNTLTGKIIVPISSRILQFPGSFTYSYQDPFGSLREILQAVAGIKGWTIAEDNVTIADYTSTDEHPVLSLSDESVVDVCRKFLELSGAKVETNLFPEMRVYSEVQNVINNVNTHTVDESMIFEDSLIYRIDFDNVLNEQTTRSVQKINANVVVGSSEALATFEGSQGTTDPRRVQTDVVNYTNFDLSTPTVLVEHRVNKAGVNSISFSGSGRFFAVFGFDSFEEQITGGSWNSFVDGDDFVVQLRHTIVVLTSGNSRMWTFPAVEYSLTVNGSRIRYGDGTIEDVKIVTAQRPIGGISETLKGDVYENPYIETDQHCANICDAILLEHGNPYSASFEIPVYEGRTLNIGDRLNITKNSSERFRGLIKTLFYSINLATGQNSIRVVAKGVGIGI